MSFYLILWCMYSVGMIYVCTGRQFLGLPWAPFSTYMLLHPTNYDEWGIVKCIILHLGALLTLHTMPIGRRPRLTDNFCTLPIFKFTTLKHNPSSHE